MKSIDWNGIKIEFQFPPISSIKMKIANCFFCRVFLPYSKNMYPLYDFFYCNLIFSLFSTVELKWRKYREAFHIYMEITFNIYNYGSIHTQKNVGVKEKSVINSKNLFPIIKSVIYNKFPTFYSALPLVIITLLNKIAFENH